MALRTFQSLFSNCKLPVIGMIHAKPLPGTPLHKTSITGIIDEALNELDIYKTANVDGVMIENMWDLPYSKAHQIGPEIVATMTRLSSEVRRNLPSQIPCGLQILAGCNKEALAVSKAADLQFIRAEGFVFGHVADEGWIDACAGELLRYRRSIDAQHILIFTDIKKKHSAHAITKDVSLIETAKAAQFFLSDGLILTGASTGSQTNPQELEDVILNTDLPVLIGSGMTTDNLDKFVTANGLIVGSHFKKDGQWCEQLQESKVTAFMKKITMIREGKDFKK